MQYYQTECTGIFLQSEELYGTHLSFLKSWKVFSTLLFLLQLYSIVSFILILKTHKIAVDVIATSILYTLNFHIYSCTTEVWKTIWLHLNETFARNLLSAHDVISRHAIAVTQCPGRLITSCCTSSPTQSFWTMFRVFTGINWMLIAETISALI